MGNRIGGGQKKIRRLSDEEISNFEKGTLFTSHEILMLHKAYREYAAIDGTVDRERFVDMFSNYNKSAKALLFLDHIFRTWDFDARGDLTFKDFLEALSVTARGTRQQRSEYLFKLYDIDQSGEITIDEFSNVLKLRLRKIELTNLEDIFKNIDSDGSGSLSFDEFVQACSTNTTLIEYLDLY